MLGLSAVGLLQPSGCRGRAVSSSRRAVPSFWPGVLGVPPPLLGRRCSLTLLSISYEWVWRVAGGSGERERRLGKEVTERRQWAMTVLIVALEGKEWRKGKAASEL